MFGETTITLFFEPQPCYWQCCKFDWTDPDEYSFKQTGDSLAATRPHETWSLLPQPQQVPLWNRRIHTDRASCAPRTPACSQMASNAPQNAFWASCLLSQLFFYDGLYWMRFTLEMASFPQITLLSLGPYLPQWEDVHRILVNVIDQISNKAVWINRSDFLHVNLSE